MDKYIFTIFILDAMRYNKETDNENEYSTIKLLSEKKIQKEVLNKYPIQTKESILIIDIEQQKVLLAKGFKNLFGYEDDTISLDFVIKNQHPDDSNLVHRVGIATLNYAFKNPTKSNSYSLLISYRRARKDGSYTKILSHTSVYETNENGTIKSLFIKYTDISFLEKTDLVQWNFEMDGLNVSDFKNSIYQAYKDLFTERELEIIKQLEKGYKSKEIAQNLFISKNTVATHRKHILKKANKNNMKDLILFCIRKGLL